MACEFPPPAAMDSLATLFQTVMNETAEAVFVKDRDGRYLLFNQAASRILGLAPAAVLGRTDHELFSPGDADQIAAADRRVLESGVPITLEEQLTLGEKLRVFSTTKAPWRNEQGAILGLVGIARDITAQKQAEADLRRSEARYRAFVDHAGDAMFLHRPGGVIVDVNQQACDVLGYSREELLGRLPFFDPTLTSEKIAAIGQQLQQPEVVRFETTHRRKDGAEFPVEVRIRSFRVDEERYSISLVSDITERRRMTQALQEERALLRTLIDAAPDVIYSKDSEGRYVVSNQAHHQFFAAAKDSAVNKTARDFCPPDVAESIAADDRLILSGEAPLLHREERVLGFGRGWHWRQLVKAPLKNAAGQIVGLVGISRDIQDLKDAEAGIRRSEERYRLALEHSQVVVWEADMCGNFVYVSPFAAQLLGCPREQWLEPGFWISRLHPDDAQWAAEFCLSRSRMGIDHRLEYRLLHNDGRIVWVDDIVHVVQEAGGVVSIRGVLIDITERRRTESITLAKNRVLELIAQGVELPEILRQINHLVENCLVNSASSVLILDESDKTLHFIADDRLPPELLNANEGSFIGPNSGEYGTAACIGDPIIIADVSADPRAASFRDVALQYGIRACWRLPVFTSTDKSPCIAGTLAVYLDKTGEPTPAQRDALRRATHLAGIAISRERALRRLSESQRFIQGVADASPSVLYLFDLPTRSLEYVSRQIEAELGYAAEEVTTMGQGGFLTLLHPDDQAQMPQRFGRWNQARDGETLETEYRLRAKDGGWRWFLSRDTVFSRAADGTVLQLVGIAQNITTRKLLEEHLRQSQKREAIGRLAGGVAHDFNNLLTVVRSATELMLAQTDANHPFRGDLDLVLRAAERGASLTQRLLAFGRRQEWSLEPLDVNQTLRELLPLLQRAVGRGVRLTCNLAPDLRPIRGDSVGLEQALLNLALNASDAMPDGGCLAISTLLAQKVPTNPGEAPPAAVWIEVQDTGVGIDPAALPRIFDPFFTTKSVGSGAGLGLAVVDGIVSQFGGTIAVESQPGAGARFRLAFPALPAEPD